MKNGRRTLTELITETLQKRYGSALALIFLLLSPSSHQFQLNTLTKDVEPLPFSPPHLFIGKWGEEVDVTSIWACRPRIFFINGFLCFLEDEWQRNGERKRERRCHFKEKMSLEEAHHHRRPWIRAWRKKEMNEGRGREEHEILCSKWALKSEV